MQDKLLELITRLEQIAPEIWRIAVQQVIVEARLNVFWGIIMAIAALASGFGAFLLFGVAISDETDSNDEGMFMGFGVFVSFIAFVALLIAISNFTSAYRNFANPEWQALQLLLRQLK